MRVENSNRTVVLSSEYDECKGIELFSSVYPIEARPQHRQTNANVGVLGPAIAFGDMPYEIYFKFPRVREITKQIGEFWNFNERVLFLNFKPLFLAHL